MGTDAAAPERQPEPVLEWAVPAYTNGIEWGSDSAAGCARQRVVLYSEKVFQRGKGMEKKMIDQSCADFTAALASKQPVPGGGGCGSAYSGAWHGIMRHGGQLYERKEKIRQCTGRYRFSAEAVRRFAAADARTGGCRCTGICAVGGRIRHPQRGPRPGNSAGGCCTECLSRPPWRWCAAVHSQ